MCFFLNVLNARGEYSYHEGAAALIQGRMLDINYIVIGL